MKKQSCYALLAVLAIAAIGCNRSGGGSVSGDLAVVNGEAIPLDEFYSYLQRKPTVQVAVPSDTRAGQQANGQVVGSLGFQALRDLINRRLLVQIAKDEGVYPKDSDIEAELAFQTKRRPDFVKQLTAQGMTLQEIKSDLTLDLAKERVVTKGITITKDEAQKFVKENPGKFKSPEQAELLYIVSSSEQDKQNVDRELGAGKDFGKTAAQYSKAQGARQTNGQFPISMVAQMPPALQVLVQKTGVGKTTDWKQEGSQWVKFYVAKKVAPKDVPIDDTMIETVRRMIASQRGMAATDLEKRMAAKLKSAKIEVQLPALKPLWDTAFKTLQQADASTGTQGVSDSSSTSAPAK